ncbi:MAG TPA: hypothetical protein VGI39_35980, partial [Polyangiaceae bacterium]
AVAAAAVAASLYAGATTACTDPNFHAVSQDLSDAAPAAAPTVNEDCPASAEWFPSSGATPPVRMFNPTPHPDTECPFYRGAYQNFLIATQPLPTADPAIVQYPTIDDAFVSATPHGVRNTSQRAWLGVVKQAGERQVLIDQDHHTLYYGIHMNQAFVDFIQANHLQTVNGILQVDPLLSFPPGLVEFKTAWKDIDHADFPGGVVPPPGGYPGDPGDYSNYLTTKAWVPTLAQDPVTGVINEDADHPRLIKVALVALHSVFTLPGHPEFIWGSVQHVNLNATDPSASAAQGSPMTGAPDDQPDTPALPVLVQPDGAPGDPYNLQVTAPLSSSGFLLYAAGTPENAANRAYSNQALRLDPTTQSFPGQQTSIYRMFPGSKSQQIAPDSAVTSLNQNLASIASQQKAAGGVDVRLNYHLVAAVWMDKPALFGLGPDGRGLSLQNDDSTNPLLHDAVTTGNLHPEINEGTFCGTPLGPAGASGDLPGGLTANTAPGCVTRTDVLAQAPSVELAIENDIVTNGTDSPFSILGGEDRLSSTAMESFTQSPSAFPNCFSCHNTQPVTTNGTPSYRDPSTQVLLPKPALINVSHLFSEFILRECGGPADGPNSTCPGYADAGLEARRGP